MVTLTLSILNHARMVVKMAVAVLIRVDSQYCVFSFYFSFCNSVRRKARFRVGQYLVGDISANVVTILNGDNQGRISWTIVGDNIRDYLPNGCVALQTLAVLSIIQDFEKTLQLLI